VMPLALAACGSGGGGAGAASATKPTTTTATTAAPARTKTKTVTIRVMSVVSARHANDTPPKGASEGDTIHFRDRLLNRLPQFGKEVDEQVGTDRGTLTLTGPHTARLEGEAVLPDGRIRFSGEMTPVAHNSVTVPIVGGTGAYENASGTLLVGSGLNRAVNVFHLVLDGVPVGPAA
jgi:allene oxide cyclase-like protein